MPPLKRKTAVPPRPPSVSICPLVTTAMSRDNSPRDSLSESSNSSPNAVYMLRSEKEITDLALFGATVTKHHRSATVRRASSASLRKRDSSFSKSQDDFNIPVILPAEERRCRRSLDSTYRQSLESISEYKTKNSFSTCSLGPASYRESLDSTSSDCTDYATRSATEGKDENKTFASPNSVSYLSWIESVNSEYFTNTTTTTAEVADVDNKVGEWNNFWLNYNNPNNRYASSPYLCSNEDRTGDDISDCKSTCSTQREFNDKIANEQVVLTFEEVQEALHCSQRLVDILQKALKRSDADAEIFNERSRMDSYYSTQTDQLLQMSFNEDNFRERNYSYTIDPLELQKQKSMLKPPQQPPTQQSTNSCINALLSTGVADILKRVMNKRREVLAPEEGQHTARSSFSEWSSGTK